MMKIYFAQGDSERGGAPAKEAFRQAVRERCPGESLIPVSLPFACPDDEFYMQNARYILWGKIFNKPFSLKDWDRTAGRIQEYTRLLTKKIIPYLFFPDFHESFVEALPNLKTLRRSWGEEGDMFFFKYRYLKRNEEDCLVMDECAPFEKFQAAVEVEAPGALASNGRESELQDREFHFYRAARLLPEELSEFFEFEMEFQSLFPS